MGIPNNMRESGNSSTQVVSSFSSYCQKPSNTKNLNIDYGGNDKANKLQSSYSGDASSFCDKRSVDMDSPSMDGSINDSSIKLRPYELPSLRSPLLSNYHI